MNSSQWSGGQTDRTNWTDRSDLSTERKASAYTPPWPQGWREAAWARLGGPWDLIVVGGGITGAGILTLASRMGLRVLLLEQGDFAAGASSRSSKLVHGGLRYLKQMQFRLTRESVHERQYLLGAAPGLISPLNFIYPIYEGDHPGAWLLELGLGMYTRMASGAGKYQELAPVDLLMLAPGLSQRHLQQGYLYGDASTDDARLVLRVLHDALIAGQGRALALNYARAAGLLRAGDQVVGVQVRDELTGREGEALARLVINATGAWADDLRAEMGAAPRLRPLRGSHLFFRAGRFPCYQAVAMIHPDDHRPVFALPWDGVTLVGTTDIDHGHALNFEPRISAEEADYLLEVCRAYFPSLELSLADVISTQAGVRPVVDTGKAEPSKEHRDHVVWQEQGLLTVTGGKLTTFRLIALDALRAAHEMAPELPRPDPDLPVLEPTDGGPGGLDLEAPAPGIDPNRLRGRYGAAAPFIAASPPELLAPLAGTPYLLAELAWSASHEAVARLEDLLLRRFRLGILLPDGGLSLLPQLRPTLQPALGWDDARWSAEVNDYIRRRRQAHSVSSNQSSVISR